MSPLFISSIIVQNLPLFAIQGVAEIVLDSLHFMQKHKQVELYGYVVMENHIHMIAKSDELPAKIQAFKSYTARRTVDYLKANNHTRLLRILQLGKTNSKKESQHQVWNEGYYPILLHGKNLMLQKLNYIHQNPVKRGYVDRPEHWRYSSARNYAGREGLIPVRVFAPYVRSAQEGVNF